PNPARPVLLATLAGGPGFDIELTGNRALVAAGEHGLVVVDVTNPGAPSLAAWYDTSGSADAVAHDGTTVYLAAGAAQHWVFACQDCPAACSFGAAVTPPDADICPSDSAAFDASSAASGDCPAAAIRYQWYEDGGAIAGA